MEATGSFKALFDALHAGHDYSPLLDAHVAYLPGAPATPRTTAQPLFEPPEDRRYSLVFIDGCKSWYGTRLPSSGSLPLSSPAATVVFQDYGWYTCFWLPASIGALRGPLPARRPRRRHLRVRACTRSTARRSCERFPDAPADFGRDAFDDLFLRCGIDAGERSDMHAIVALTIQHAGAMAYLGLIDEARAHIAGDARAPRAFPYRSASSSRRCTARPTRPRVRSSSKGTALGGRCES